MKAIILAAGLGSRLMPLTKDIPKCMLKVGDKSIIEWIVLNLRKCGVDDIIIVTGHKQNKIKELFKDSLQYRYNPFYKFCNQIGSALFAVNDMDSAFTYIHADVFFDIRVLQDLLKKEEDICIAVEPRDKFDEEDHKVRIERGLVKEVHKETIPQNEAYGEFLGIVKFSDKGAKLIKKEICDIMKDEKNLDKYFSFALNSLIKKGVPIHYCNIKHPWIEIDFVETLEEARNQTLPKIIK